MNMRDEIEKEISLLIEEWARAEEFIKETELAHGKVLTPSIKELRYAGRRIIDALREQRKPIEDERATLTHLIEARENCRKSQHDAIDSVFSIIFKDLERLIRLGGEDKIATIFPKYTELGALLKEMGGKLVASRANRDLLDDIYLGILRDNVRRALALFSELQVAKPLVALSIDREKKRFWFSIGISAIISLATGAFISWIM